MISVKMLAFPPLIIMLILLVIEAGTFAASGQSLCIPNPNSGNNCGGATGSGVGSVVIACPLGHAGPCEIQNNLAGYVQLSQGKLPYCQSTFEVIFGPNPPPPAYCGSNFGLPPWVAVNGKVLLNPGDQVLVSQSSALAVSSQFLSTNFVAFIFTDITSNAYGFVAMILVALGLVALAGITVLNSSATNPESLQLLFVCGLLSGIWIMLSLAEGFILGNSASFLYQLNSIKVQGQPAQFGTFIYLFLSMVEGVGIIGFASRGM